jgi:hypothetical protein
MERHVEIDVQSRDLPLSDAHYAAVRGAAERCVGALGDRPRSIAVRIYEFRGSKAGLDKGCIVVVDFADGRVVVSSDVDRDLRCAIDRAFAKLGQGVTSPAADGGEPAPPAEAGSALVGLATGHRTGTSRAGNGRRPRG